MAPPVESLNVAVAAGVVLFEAHRQRAARQDGPRHEPPRPLRRRRTERRASAGPRAAGRAHAPADVRRVRRARRSCSRPGSRCARPSSATCCSRSSSGARRAPARRASRAWSPRPPHAHFIAFSAVLSGIKEIKEVMAEAAARAPAPGPADHPVRGRDSPLQQGAAGRVPAARRGRRHRPHRRDDREPVVRGQRAAAVALAGVRAAGARRDDDHPHRSSTARWPTPSAASAREAVRVTDEALRCHRALRQRRRARGA